MQTTASRMTWQHIRLPLALLMVALALILLGGWYFYYNEMRPVSVGITGYAANITLSGFGAPTFAQTSVDQSKGTSYLMTTAPTGVELCTGNVQGITYIVRDTGSIMAVGNQICVYMQKVYIASLHATPANPNGNNNTAGPGAIVWP